MTSPVQRTSDRCAQDPGISCVIRGGPFDPSLVRPSPTTTPRYVPCRLISSTKVVPTCFI